MEPSHVTAGHGYCSDLLRRLTRVEEELQAVVASAGPVIWMPPRPSLPLATPVAVTDVVPLPVGWLAIGLTGEEIAVAPVVMQGSRVRRASVGDGVFAAILRATSDVVPGLSGRQVAAALPTTDEERSFGEQTNELVIVGERAVVKLFARTTPGAQPGVDLPAHLAAVGFTELPAPIGSVWWGDALVATVTAYVPGALDGWTWYVASVESAAIGDASWADVDAHAATIGGLVARLHRALASPSEVLPSPVGWGDAERIALWRRAAESMFETASALIDGREGERLRALAPAARAAIATLDDVGRTPIMRIHGDLHVGQILRTPDGTLRVNDFDGNPLASAPSRAEPHAPARDVASMLAAIDHVGRVVARRRPDTEAVIGPWIERAREAFLAAYREGLGDRRDLLDERLLGPFAVAQEAHEFVYAALYEPGWRAIPDAALPAALARIGAR